MKARIGSAIFGIASFAAVKVTAHKWNYVVQNPVTCDGWSRHLKAGRFPV